MPFLGIKISVFWACTQVGCAPGPPEAAGEPTTRPETFLAIANNRRKSICSFNLGYVFTTFCQVLCVCRRVRIYFSPNDPVVGTRTLPLNIDRYRYIDIIKRPSMKIFLKDMQAICFSIDSLNSTPGVRQTRDQELWTRNVSHPPSCRIAFPELQLGMIPSPSTGRFLSETAL